MIAGVIDIAERHRLSRIERSQPLPVFPTILYLSIQSSNNVPTTFLEIIDFNHFASIQSSADPFDDGIYVISFLRRPGIR